MTHPPASALPDASIATPVLRVARLLRCNVRPRRRIGAATQRAPATCFRSNDHAGDRDTRVASETLRPRQRQPRQRRSTAQGAGDRSEEHTSELQSLMRISYAVFCLKKKRKITRIYSIHNYASRQTST